MQEYLDFFQANQGLTFAWVAIFIALFIVIIKMSITGIKKISYQAATLLINREEAVVLDVRTEADFKKGHIIGSKQIAMSRLKNNELNSIEKHKNSPIIVVCETGMTSSQACQILLKSGFSNINILQGGITEWRTANLPLTKK